VKKQPIQTLHYTTLVEAGVPAHVLSWLRHRRTSRLRPAGTWAPRVKGFGWTYAPPKKRDPDDLVERALVARAVCNAKVRQARADFYATVRALFSEHDALARLERCVEPEPADASQFAPTAKRPRTREDFVEQHRRSP
jgi:hypothetical protein